MGRQIRTNEFEAPLLLRDDPHVREIWCDGLLFEAAPTGPIRAVGFAARNAGAETPTLHVVAVRLIMPRHVALAACADCSRLIAGTAPS